MAGCSETRAKRHLQLFVYESWDPHPPESFVTWYAKHGPGPSEGKPANPIPAWNSARTRAEFEDPQPEPELSDEEFRQGVADFEKLMGRRPLVYRPPSSEKE